ncbi:MAG: hypothetical protein JW953_06670 [Anaerolineae bacterium]|nr:hypothetical protein [Anaerolineae bacterium]
MGTKGKFFTKQSIITGFAFGVMVWLLIFLKLEPISAAIPPEQAIARHLLQSSPDCPPDYTPGVYLYAEPDFKGVCYHTTTDIADLGQTPLGDNNVSSVQLRGWYIVKLYEHPYWQGRTKEIMVDEGNLGADVLGGKYSSLRLYPQQETDLVSNIRVASGQNYYLSWCKIGDEYYLDRDYTFTNFSKDKYDDLPCIKTANADKDNSTSTFLTFELNEPAFVYIYFDRRVSRPPGWMDLFRQTENKAFVSDHNLDYFVIYACNSHPGAITLGGPQYGGGGAKAMYVVAFREGVWSEQLCTGIQPPATPTYTPTPKPTPTVIPTPTPRGDVTGDGRIDIFDLSFVAARYGSNDSVADINGDGLVDIFDLVIVAGNYCRF